MRLEGVLLRWCDMRLRTDGWWRAGMKRAVLCGAVPNPLDDPEGNWDPKYLAFLRDGEEAKPGDVWRVSWVNGGEGVTRDGQPVPERPAGNGYAMTCPRESCKSGAHSWVHASDCQGAYGDPCKVGAGRVSCWDWTGSPEEGNLTANPSLYIMGPESGHHGCGFHGFLRDGVLAE